MLNAQLMPEHTAQRVVAQCAYACGAMRDTPRQARRRTNLALLVTEFGGATALASLSGTPKSHISAILAARRGIGDTLAAKWERKTGKQQGWFDQEHTAAPTLAPLSEEALAWARLYEDASPHERARFRLLELAARDGVRPTNFPPAPAADVSQPADGLVGGISGLGELDEQPPPPARSAKKGKGP